MDIQKGDIIISLSGRDKDMAFFVINTENEYLYLANGELRKIENPKKKKVKHVRFALRPEIRVREKILAGEKVLDAELRKALKQLNV